MLKNILKLEGAQKLTKNEQKSINGGLDKSHNCNDYACPINTHCEIIVNAPKCIVDSEMVPRF